MKGQAHIVFETQEQADKALEALDGWIIYNKPMQINYSRITSDVEILAAGDQVPKSLKEERFAKQKEFEEW